MSEWRLKKNQNLYRLLRFPPILGSNLKGVAFRYTQTNGGIDYCDIDP